MNETSPGSLVVWVGLHNWKDDSGPPKRLPLVIKEKSDNSVLIFRAGQVYEVNRSEIDALEDKNLV